MNTASIAVRPCFWDWHWRILYPQKWGSRFLMDQHCSSLSPDLRCFFMTAPSGTLDSSCRLITGESGAVDEPRVRQVWPSDHPPFISVIEPLKSRYHARHVHTRFVAFELRQASVALRARFFFFFSSVLGCLTCPVFKRGDEECDWILPLKADDGLFGFSSEDWIIQLKAKKKNDTRIGAYYIQLSAAIPCIWSRRAEEMIDTGLKRMWIHPIWHLWRGIAWAWSMLSGCICLTWAGAVGPAVCFQPRSGAKQ